MFLYILVFFLLIPSILCETFKVTEGFRDNDLTYLAIEERNGGYSSLKQK